ncbi:DUF6985 domain-containing protein [Mycobacteroides abscessus]|uniref:DUF6985 domain-containing protein n=1 Tax=Mycobacteroides abscessus TaxID=36809 RepID=UPI0005E6C08A|nr:hypothetical protein [Mycobacteroides abscessus]CPX14671.1 Uncharacterised protein [Mycobacteroides abscessus]
MIDPVLGSIAFTQGAGWEGAYTYPFFGQEVTVTLALGGWEESDPVEPQQIEAVAQFNMRKAELCAQAEDAIYAYYLEHLSDLREQFGDSADDLMPIIEGKQEIPRLVKPTDFFVQLAFSADRVIGLLYDCTWDADLGLAVKFVNEAIEEVGPQDIVL